MFKFVVEEETQPAGEAGGRLAAYLAAAHRLRKAQAIMPKEPATEPAAEAEADAAMDTAAAPAACMAAATDKVAAGSNGAEAANSQPPLSADVVAFQSHSGGTELAAAEAGQPAADGQAAAPMQAEAAEAAAAAGSGRKSRMSGARRRAAAGQQEAQGREGKAAGGADQAGGGMRADPPPPLQQVCADKSNSLQRTRYEACLVLPAMYFLSIDFISCSSRRLQFMHIAEFGEPGCFFWS